MTKQPHDRFYTAEHLELVWKVQERTRRLKNPVVRVVEDAWDFAVYRASNLWMRLRWRVRHRRLRDGYWDANHRIVEATYKVLRCYIQDFADGLFIAEHPEMDAAIRLVLTAPLGDAFYEGPFAADVWLKEVAKIMPELWD